MLLFGVTDRWRPRPDRSAHSKGGHDDAVRTTDLDRDLLELLLEVVHPDGLSLQEAPDRHQMVL